MAKEKKLNTKQELLASMLEESLTRSEFKELANKLIEVVKSVKDNNLKEIDSMKKAVDTYSGTISSTSDANFKGLKEEIDGLVKNHTSMSSNAIAGKIKELDDKIATIKNGKDADETTIVDKVLELIKIPTIEEIKDDLPIMGEEVRDSLELLKGDERIDASAIKGLKKLLEKPKTMGAGFNYGAVNIRMIDDETPAGLVNSSNKVYTTSLTPSPAVSLKLYLNGQRMKITEDYTLASKTITFLVAPLTNSILTVDYRV